MTLTPKQEEFVEGWESVLSDNKPRSLHVSASVISNFCALIRELAARVEKLEKEAATVAGMRVQVDETIPHGEIHVRNDKGELVGKIVNVLTSEGKL